ncbi:MAG: right-handed parallel beta-helix repeat-containing protein [Verrucomicrobia bacterium]|nr:right-handed parallel beta-helix repeat-containing protein [Verrucomicrobiota bacterium]MCH8513108.1 right-handed parallel beta-helix repeat-containing protein [Kiritimatiellia bacterium]
MATLIPSSDSVTQSGTRYRRILRVSASAPEENPVAGASDGPVFSSIQAAAEVAEPGDVIRIRAGIYREWVRPRRGGTEDAPVVYQAEAGARVSIRGSEQITGWFPAADAVNLWCLDVASLPCAEGLNPFLLDVRRYNLPVRPFEETDEGVLAPTRGQVFWEGALLRQVTRETHLHRFPGSWMVDAAGQQLFLHPPAHVREADPNRALVELSVRHRIFAPDARGLGHVHLRGLTFEHCANPHPTPQIAAVSTRGGHDWVIEDCVIRHANTIGLDLGCEWGIEETPEAGDLDLDHGRFEEIRGRRLGHHLVRRNHICDNGLGGVMGMVQFGTRFVENVVERNNTQGFRTFEMGAVKFHFFFDGVIERNLIRDNDCYGVWLDNRYAGSRVSRNLIVNNLIAGVFMEMGLGPAQIDHNVIAHTRNGDGVYAHDASGITIAHNLLYANSHAGVTLTLATDRTLRDGKPSRCSGNLVANNIIAASKRCALSFPVPWELAENNRSEGNLLMGGGNPMDEGSGPDVPLFHINGCHNRFTPEQIRSRLGLVPDDSLAGAAGGSLEAWRRVTGRDLRSEIFQLRRDMLGVYSLSLDASWPEEVLRHSCEPVTLWEGDTDYFGDRMAPGEPYLPGPFRILPPEIKSRLPLWPPPANPGNSVFVSSCSIPARPRDAGLSPLSGNGL